ncbi:MAG: 2Fe-2S iron-sulfur cluster binding domain-containing protein, partial [Firmicutes bacterium]|nr:2Fe-2S iron-sulfur cluster binding domain-containing protein [Bacillota bacterium]
MKLSDALNIPLDCGGKGRCGKCKVYVSGQLSPLTQAEISLLTQEEIDAGCRLACQAEIEGEYVVHKTHKEDDMVVQTGFGAADSGVESSPSPISSDHIGIAVDIGTTTLAAYWYDLTCGQLIDQRSSANPQRIFGADVISRIERAMAGDLMQLSAVLRRGILELLPEKWDRLVLTGNTTMLYTLCGHDPEPLSHAPFIADHTYGYEKDGVILPPCFSAYVGADLSTAALAAGLWKDGRLAVDKPTLLLDAGTNGEILLA